VHHIKKKENTKQMSEAGASTPSVNPGRDIWKKKRKPSGRGRLWLNWEEAKGDDSMNTSWENAPGGASKMEETWVKRTGPKGAEATPL